jgi:prophage regulatory protein
MNERLLSEAEVQALTGLSRSTRWRNQRLGLFPHPLRISRNRIAWRESAIRAWLDECARQIQPEARANSPAA